ncbi:malectin domain-containing carbohydrate-binding protein, partial [Neolewinella persica]|uniref:malectin domain-containing carbohydrate-binding protein n=1 Tax=Neolewinella persica TaxID=70998 RepID=UPI0004762764
MNFRQVLLSVFTTLLYFQVGLSQLAITTPDDVNVLEGTTATADVTVTEDGNSATVTFVLYDKSEPVGSTNNPITPSTVISSGDYSITQNVDTYTFSWPTPTGSGRSYLVKVTADDGQNTVVDYFSVNVAQAIPGNILARTFASPLPWYGGSPGAGFTVAIEPPPAAKNIGWITDGEFVEYLIDVPVPGQLYLLEVFAGKGNNGTFNVNIMEEDGGGGFSQIGTVAKTKPPGTNPWQTYTPPITTQVSFSNAGLQTMRFDFQGAGGINIRDFEFTNAYTLDASAGTNGTIAPSGQLVLEEGADQTYTFTPDGGYEIEEVLVDGSPVTLTNDEYTFTNVMADATISVSFVASSVNTYTLTPTAGANGAIDPATAVVVNEGTNQLFTFTPDPGFQVADVLVDGSSVGAVNSYEFVNIIADATIAVSFEPIPFSPIYVNVGGGAYTAQGGTVFQADNGASGGTVYPTGSNQIMTLDGVDFTNTLDDELFRTERYGDYSVDFTVPNGDYVVDLYFAEIFQGVLGGGAALPGERVFDVAVEGNLVLDDFDAINPASGGAFAPATGIVKSFLVSVTDNEININVVTVVDNAKLSALCIREPGVANQAPVIAAIPNVSITAGQTASATISATDEVGVTGFQIQVIKDSDNSVVDPADYTFVQNGNSVDFDWVTTDPDDVGDYTATVLAFDGLDVSSANFPIAVAGPQDITVDPLSVDFGVVEVNVGSAPTMITISNSGGSDLSVSEINLINNGDAEFALSNLPGLPAAIPAGSSVDFEVDFTPVNLGAATATINIVSNDPSEGTVTISLSGEGSDNPPVITNPGEQRHFEDDVITLPITVTDNGTPTISVSGLPAGLTFNGSNEISGTIAAGAAAAGPYTVIISADDGINLPVEVTFDWLIYVPCENVLYRVNAGGPLLTSTDAGPDWGQDEGTGADASPYYVNNGGGDKTYTSNISGAVNMSHPSIPPGYPEALFVKERYDPPATANPANPAEMLYQFPVSIGAEIEVKLLFGEAFSGVTSAGQRVFDVSVEGVVPPVFDDIDPYGTAGPKGAFILSYTYIATDATLDVEFLHDVIENPAVKGFEICEITPPPSPEITVAPTSIDFGGVDENTSSAPETVTITNDGTGDLTVSAITLTNNGDGEFSLDNLPGLPATITA